MAPRASTFNRMRVRGEFDRVIDGVRNLHRAGVPIEINFSPTHFNVDEISAAVDLAFELARIASIPAARCTRATLSRPGVISRCPDAQYARVLRRPAHRRPKSIAAACASISTKQGCSRSCATACTSGRTADRASQRPRQAHQRLAVRLRRFSPPDAAGVWANFRRAWQDPRVAQFIDDLPPIPARRGPCINGYYSDRAAPTSARHG